MLRTALRSFRTLIETAELAAMFDANEAVHVLEASLSGVPNDHFEARLPQAKIFSIGDAASKATKLPMMLPTANEFADYLGSLGIAKDGRQIVCYDRAGICFAPRVWWTFKTYGWENVAVLNGGLLKWVSEGRAIQSGKYEVYSEAASGDVYTRAKGMVSSLDDVQAFEALSGMGSNLTQAVDARPPRKFAGADIEPAGVIAGHVGGAKNTPATAFLTDDGTLRPDDELAQIFRDAGIDLKQPIISYCMVGVSACVPLLALDKLGAAKYSLYDGSWAEYNQTKGDRTMSPTKIRDMFYAQHASNVTKKSADDK